ncbi:MAG: phospholipase D-like domain-containing protein [Proteobacteria bacterium]|nr:phospholipase D-like domain-containing protein [Pseudomonadota bacterium]
MGRIPRAWAAVLLIVLVAPFGEGRADPSAPVSVYYAPETNLEQVDLRILGAARKSVDLAGYNLSNYAVIHALSRLAQGGVRVRLYLDGEQLANTLRRAPQTHPLYRLGGEANVSVQLREARAAMHLKAYLVDGRVLRTGSANFSASGLKRQDNDLVVIRDTAAVGGFVATFERLWARSDNRVWRPSL